MQYINAHIYREQFGAHFLIQNLFSQPSENSKMKLSLWEQIIFKLPRMQNNIKIKFPNACFFPHCSESALYCSSSNSIIHLTVFYSEEYSVGPDPVQ